MKPKVECPPESSRSSNTPLELQPHYHYTAGSIYPRTYHGRNNFMQLYRARETMDLSWQNFSSKMQVTSSMVNRLGVVKELDGHIGCVNCIQFNDSGSLLVSGSDDFKIILWNVHQQKKLKSLATGHRGNIFSVKFMPQTGDSLVVSGAGDRRVEIRDVESGEVSHVCTCHRERVKRIATVSSLPHMFFTASEDGSVMVFDTRVPHSCNAQSNNVLIDLRYHVGRTTECKCIAINPFRTELLAVGASDPYIRVYDRRMIKPTKIKYPSAMNSWERDSYCQDFEQAMDNLPPGCVQYFVPGHLPNKMSEYYRRCHALATTYLSYTQDGCHLLANLGGEHIYLYNTLHTETPICYSSPIRNTKTNIGKESHTNGVCKVLGSTNGFSSSHVQGSSKQYTTSDSPMSMEAPPLPRDAECLKTLGNQAFNDREYLRAIQLYNEAISFYSNSAVIFSNRAAALLRRDWEGDSYQALKDCFQALSLDPNHIKAHFRMARCLYLLGRGIEAQQCLEEFKQVHSELGTSSSCSELNREIVNLLNQAKIKEAEIVSDDDGIIGAMPTPSARESEWRTRAKDYSNMYCGHCNTTTDIKEAVFFGKDGNYIAAGSDDGNLFIWDRHTTNLVRVLPGDDSIVNCVQAHPNTCLLATSGIESVVKLWGPLPKVDDVDEGTLDVEKVSRANQHRMNADPLEMMLMQMGNMTHVLSGNGGDIGDGSEDNDEGSQMESGRGGGASGDEGEGRGGGGAGTSGGRQNVNVPDVQCRTS